MIEKLLTDWEWTINRPENYGWYHIMWLVIMVIACVISCLLWAKKHDKKTDDKFIFTIGCVLILAEIYKQVFFTLDAQRYQWYAIPFQFCSIPMYVAFIAPLIKKEVVKEGLYKFLATFGLLAGVAVMVYPSSCLNTKYITILIHTMLWHSSMVVMGVYLNVSRNYGQNLKELIPGVIVFSIAVVFAVAANFIAYDIYFGDPLKNIYNDSFNLLYVSPYYDTPFPIIGEWKRQMPYAAFLILYIAMFSLGSLLLWSIVYVIRKAVLSVNTKRPNFHHA